ncbi:uncharacterized protein LOC133181510 [Saccostrea echinata]|uniref:uncharacterized protein LOC133181510 n=1 Tax=Saccostrea echinata TaxID=191078 RepID=UPI002A83D2E1|nr:uncharacterized protein LOC133181510 [Saccostrea echinata]
MPRTRKWKAKTTTKTSPPETVENSLLKDYDDNIIRTLATAEDFVVNNPPSLMGMLYGDLPPSVVWKVLYLVNRQITSEEECTLLCLLTDYLAGECVDLGLLNPSNKYNTQTHVLLEEVANAWNNVLQQPRVFKDNKLLKSLLSNLKKSLSSFTVFGFDHYFSRTLDIVSKHELNQSIVPFFTYPMVPKNFSIPEYKVKRILSAGKVPRQDLYSSYQDTAGKLVSQSHKKPRWDSSDIEWVPSDDDLDTSSSISEFDGKDLDPLSDVDSPLNSDSEELISHNKEPFKDVSNFSSSVKPDEKGKKTQRDCLENLKDQGEKFAVEQKENLIGWKDHYHYEFGYSSPLKDKKALQNCQNLSNSKQSINSIGDTYTDYSDCSLSPVIRKRCKDSPPRIRKGEVRENERKVKTAQRDLYADDSDQSLSPIVKKRYKDSLPSCRNDDFRGKDNRLKTAQKDLYVSESGYSLSPIAKKRYEGSPSRCRKEDVRDEKEKRKQRDGNVGVKDKKGKTLKDPKEKLSLSYDSELKRKEVCQRWTDMSGREEESKSTKKTWGYLYDDEYLLSQPTKPNERKNGVPLKLKKLSGGSHYKNIDMERQQSRKQMIKAFSDDSDSSLPDLDDDQNVPYSIKQCWEDSLSTDQVLFQQTEEDDYYARRVGFRSFYDTASDVESLCSSEYSDGEASVNHFISCSEGGGVSEKSKKDGFVMCKEQKHDIGNKQEDRSTPGKTFRKCHESKEKLSGGSEFLYDDMSYVSETTKQKKRKDCKDHVCGNPAKRLKHISSPKRMDLENELIKKSMYEESFHHAAPYRTPEITKPNNRDIGREILPSSPQNPEKTPSKSRNQDIRNFFKGCC